MTLFVPAGGKRVRFAAIIEDGAATPLITPSDRAFIYTVESLSVRLKGTDVAFDFSIDDGTNDIVFAGLESINTDKYWKQDSHHVTVKFGEVLKFKAGGSTTMHVTVVALETDTSTQRQ